MPVLQRHARQRGREALGRRVAGGAPHRRPAPQPPGGRGAPSSSHHFGPRSPRATLAACEQGGEGVGVAPGVAGARRRRGEDRGPAGVQALLLGGQEVGVGGLGHEDVAEGEGAAVQGEHVVVERLAQRRRGALRVEAGRLDDRALVHRPAGDGHGSHHGPGGRREPLGAPATRRGAGPRRRPRTRCRPGGGAPRAPCAGGSCPRAPQPCGQRRAGAAGRRLSSRAAAEYLPRRE